MNQTAPLKIDIYSPLDNKYLGFVPKMNKNEVDLSLKRLHENRSKWESVPLSLRAQMFHKTADLLFKDADNVSNMLVNEIGKSFPECQDEVLRTVEDIHYFAEEGKRLFGYTQTSDSFAKEKNLIAVSTRTPLGIVLAIPPFNYPLNESAPKIIAALIGGNSVVVKPSTQGVLSFMMMAKFFKDAGIDEDILSVITGDTDEIGDYLVSHDLIDAINFTGSYKTAQHIHSVMKPVKFIAGLSGKDACLVLSDCDIKLAAKEVALGAFSYSGQRCTAIKRIVLQNSIAEEFIKELLSIISTYKTGDVRNEGITHGPVISSNTSQNAIDLIQDARSKGATILCGGSRHLNYVDITLIDNVNDSMRVCDEEPFAPVLPIIRFDKLEDGINIVNKSEYGLQASIFTKDIDKAMYIASKLEVGRVNINSKDARGPDNFPFLGVKHSGLGNVGGARFLIEETTYLKTLVLNLNNNYNE